MKNNYIPWGVFRQKIEDAQKQEVERSLEARKKKNYVSVSIHERCAGFCQQIIEAADKLVQTADAAPANEKRGEWVKLYQDNMYDGTYYCSLCLEQVDIATGEETPLDRGLKFCPNCGADMREVKIGG